MTDPENDDMEWVTCETCGGTGEIDDPEHPMHPNNTHDREDETWCLDCDGDGGRFESKAGEHV